MFEAFRKGDIEGVVETVSDDSLWIYRGTKVITRSSFEGKEGVRIFHPDFKRNRSFEIRNRGIHHSG